MMNLYIAPASPYARKALVTAIECGVRDRLVTVTTNPHRSEPDFVARNPFSKVPTLQLENGDVLFESVLICEYFDHLGGGGIVIPRQGPERWKVLRKHSFGNGLMDASVTRRVESLRPEEGARTQAMVRQAATTSRGLDALNAEADALGNRPDLGNICIAVALGYLDFRFATDRWRDGRPRLTAWYENFASRESVASTQPHD